MRTALASQVPERYDVGTFARLLRAADAEMNRLSAFAGEVTWNPASVANGASTSTTLTIKGVKANTRASVRVFAPYSLQGLVAGGYVSADDTVTIVLSNTSGGAVDLASGEWGVVVENFVLTGA